MDQWVDRTEDGAEDKNSDSEQYGYYGDENYVEVEAQGSFDDQDEIYKRAAGRKSYNYRRRMTAEFRRRRVSQLLNTAILKNGPQVWGMQARIAQELGVSEATISRDVAVLTARWTACPYCRGPMKRRIKGP